MRSSLTSCAGSEAGSDPRTDSHPRPSGLQPDHRSTISAVGARRELWSLRHGSAGPGHGATPAPQLGSHETDTAGNLWVRTGQGDGPVVIIAHLDEIGFRVDTINADGTLGLRNRGGFILSLF